MSNPETLPISWQSEAGTVYGGNLTINEDGSCVLTVDRAMVDLGSLNWGYSSSVGHERFTSNTLAPSAKPAPGSTLANAFCSCYKVATSNQVYSHSFASICCVDGDGKIQVYDSRYSDATAFKTAVTGQLFVYELATPQTYTLPSVTMLETFLGTNNIWTDVGDTAVTYSADTKQFILKKIAELNA